MQKILFLSILFTLIIVKSESTPIFNHIKDGFNKAHNALHRFTCKIKDHKGCETETEIIATELIPTTIEPEDRIDIRAGDNQEINSNIQPSTMDPRNIVRVNTCAEGHRRDRTGVCRKIV